jgi:hypothetical protein
MMTSVYGRAAFETSLPKRRVARRDRAEIALAWAITALLAIGLVWLAAGAGPAVHDLPDEVSTMMGLPLGAAPLAVVGLPPVGTPGL